MSCDTHCLCVMYGDLNSLKKRLNRGDLYRFDNDRSLNVWHLTKAAKFQQKLKPGDILLFISIEHSKNNNAGFRVHLIHGENIGYVLMKHYEVISCLKPLDTKRESS